MNFKSVTHLSYHHQLNPKLWINGLLKPAIRDRLLEIGKQWQEFAKIPDEAVIDYTLTGGNASYSYTPDSDLDVHILVNQIKLPISDPDIMHDYIMMKKNVWATAHPHISIMGYPVELYAEMTTEMIPQGRAVYSLSSNQWIIEPKQLDVHYNSPELKQMFYHYVKMIDDAVSTNNLEAAKAIKSEIVQNRGVGLARGGEFDVYNEIFKATRNSGYLKKLSDFINQSVDQSLSLR